MEAKINPQEELAKAIEFIVATSEQDLQFTLDSLINIAGRDSDMMTINRNLCFLCFSLSQIALASLTALGDVTNMPFNELIQTLALKVYSNAEDPA